MIHFCMRFRCNLIGLTNTESKNCLNGSSNYGGSSTEFNLTIAVFRIMNIIEPAYESYEHLLCSVTWCEVEVEKSVAD